jgi:hypothetical protein
MGLFGLTTQPKADPAMLEEIKGLRKDIAELKGEREARTKERDLHDEVLKLREEKEQLLISKSRVKEEQERKEREVRHEVGLLRKQVDAEQEIAVQQAKIEIREQNLKADRDRFEEQMQFTTDRFEREVGYLREIAKELMKRLPTVEVNKRMEDIVRVGANGHSASPEDAEDAVNA